MNERDAVRGAYSNSDAEGVYVKGPEGAGLLDVLVENIDSAYR